MYLGVPSAKLVLLARQAPQAVVDVVVAGASAYMTGMNPTPVLRMLKPMVVSSDSCPIKCDDTCVEVRQGLSRLALTGHFCSTNHCPFCILVQLGFAQVCPWHSKDKFDPQGCLHLNFASLRILAKG